MSLLKVQHLNRTVAALNRQFVLSISHGKILIEGNDYAILYRWLSTIPWAEDQPAVHALMLALTLKGCGYETWIDKGHLAAGTRNLKTTVKSELEKTRVAIISMGPGDLERCASRDDFFRWEIDTVRKLESAGKLRDVVIVHGTADREELISTDDETRYQIKRDMGPWGEKILTYLEKRYVIYFTMPAMEDALKKVISELMRK